VDVGADPAKFKMSKDAGVSTTSPPKTHDLSDVAGGNAGRGLRPGSSAGPASKSFREIQKFATIHVSSGAIRRIPLHRKRSPFDV